MPEIHVLLELEAASVVEADSWLEETLLKVDRRRRRRRAASAVFALLIAAGGLAVAVRAFTPQEVRPVTEGSNYEMEARVTEPDEQVGGAAGPRGADFVWIEVEVRWDPARWPGVHRCSWDVLDEAGNVISTRTMLFLPHVPPEQGHESLYIKMLDLAGKPATARAACGTQRLDTVGISDLQALPETSDWDATLAELDARLESWAERFRIDQMSPDQLAGNMWALRSATLPGQGNEHHLEIRELMMRLHALCVLLPPGHEFRGGEFCD